MNVPLVKAFETLPLTLSDGRSLEETLQAKARIGAEKAAIILAEYRRFLHLAASGPGPMVPSPLLDQVWHLHLTDTRAYAAMCEAVFGRFIHHTPGRAPQGNDPAYAQTLAAYARTFGHPPPDRIWPGAATLRVMGWIGAPLILGFALMAFGIMGLGGWVAALGAALFAGTIVWGVAWGPRTFSIGSDSRGDGCGGD